MTGLVVVDVGNTAVKAARVAGAGVVERRTFPHAVCTDPPPEDDLEAFVAGVAAGTPCALAGTRPALVERLAARLARRFTVARCPKDFRAAVENRCREQERVGHDRLFNAAAVPLLEPGVGLPAVVVDLGTAITVDLVAADGAFCGGAIAPGVQTCFAALARETELLPRLAPPAAGEAPPIPGRDTEQAIQAGVIRGLAGLVDRLVVEIEPAARAVVITGGDAELLLPFLRTAPRLERDLTLLGIAASFRAAP